MASRKPRDLGWGLLLLVLGVILLMANFGLLAWSGAQWDRWWPLILIAIGVLLLINRSEETKAEPPPAEGVSPPAPASDAAAAGAPRAFPTGAVILIGIGVAFLIDDYVGGNSFPALVLIAIGVALVLRGWWRR